MAEELKSLRESLNDVDSLNASWDVKEYMKDYQRTYRKKQKNIILNL